MKHAFKRVMATLLVLAMMLSVLPTVFAADTNPFTDVKDSDWFAQYVAWVYNHEPQLMNGVSASKFEPNEPLTRAMAAVVLYRYADPVVPSIKPSSFTDLTQDWYKNGIAWAEQTGVVNGVGGGKFEPDEYVTREAMVTMIWRYQGKPVVEQDYLKDFPDAAKVNSWAKDAFNWAISKGIINGTKFTGRPGTWLAPQDNATRAEFAKIIYAYEEATADCKEHSWDEGTVTKPATCTEDGLKTFTCTRCGETKTETIAATGHIYVDGTCTGCGTTLAGKGEIVIYYTNDVHTYVDKALSYDTIADLKKQTAKVADGVLLMDAGDHIQGTAFGSMDNGASIIEFMSAAGYDVATLGNHEFDYGMARMLELVARADYPYVSANFYHEKDGVPGDSVLDSYKVFELGGKKIAIIGVTTPESFTKSTPKYFMDEAGNYIYGIAGGEDGSGLYAAVQKAIDDASKEADYVIALAHLGDDVSSKPWTSEELIANTTGLDALVDGHSHSTVPMKEVTDKGGNTVILTQTGEYFNAIGKMTITAEGIKTELISDYTGSDAGVKELVDAWVTEVNTKLGEVIGHADITLDNYDADGKRLVRSQETNTGDFAADALYYLFDVTEDLQPDAAIMNGGGVRNKALTGDISYLTCKSIHTFGNVACLIEVSGQQILDALEWGAKDAGTGENGGFLQVSGITYEIHTYIPSTVQKDDKNVWIGGPTGEYRVKNVTIGGEALDTAKTYRLAGYNYTLRDLGDGFAMFDGAKNVKDYVMTDYMVLANYVKSFPVVNDLPTISKGAGYDDVNGAGRITLVTEKTEPVPTPSGDSVVIYFPKDSKVMTTEEYTYTNSKTGSTKIEMVAADATLADGVVSSTATNVAEFKMTEADGTVTFQTKDGKYLFSDGTDVKLVDTEGENTKFVLEDVEGGKNIRCATAQYNGNPQYLQYFSGYFTVYGMANSQYQDAFVLDVYPFASATTPDPDPDPEPGPTPSGDSVVIYFPKDSKVMTTEEYTYTNSKTGSTKIEMVAADATLADGVVSSTATNVAEFKMTEADGTVTFQTKDGKYLFSDGTDVKLVDTEGENTKFVLEDVEGGKNIRCATAQYNGNPQYLQYFSGYFTVYGMANSQYQDAFVLDVYPFASATTPDPDPDPDPDPTPTPSGDAVAIYFPAENKVMTTEETTYTNPKTGASKVELCSADATVTDGVLSSTATNVAEFKMIEDDGTVTFQTKEGKYLFSDGNDVKLVDAQGENTKFVLEDAEGGKYIRCATAQFSGKAQYLQYFGGYFTVYGRQNSTNPGAFILDIASLGTATTPDPDPDPTPSGETTDFAFLVTSDIHGKFFATDYSSGYEASGTYRQGITRVASYIKEMKAEYGDMLYTVDMGDTIQGEPMTYYYAFNADKLGEADPAIRALRTIGYDMWLLGNHEFNYGINILNRQMKEAVAPATETENQLVIADANYLDADAKEADADSWKTYGDIVPYVIKDFDGVKVAIIGLSTPNIPNWDGPANWKGFYFESIYETYKHYEAEMVEKADLIVVMAHCGLNSEMAEASYDSVRYLVENTNTIDFAFSGHAHGRMVNDIQNSDGETVKVLQPGTKAALISQVKVSYDKETGEFTVDAQNVNMSDYALDEETVALLKPYEDYVWKNYMLTKIGEASDDFPAANLGTAPSAFMDLINQIQINGAYDSTGLNTPDDKTDDTPAQLSISAPLTSGSSANLISKGDIFLGDLFALYRYENWFYQLTMSGKEIRTWLEFAASSLNYNSTTGAVSVAGGLTYYDVIYGEGFSYVLDPAKPADSRVVSMTYNGKEVKDDDVFTIVMNNYRFTGGGNYVKYCNEHGCDLSDLEDRIIYSTQYDMIQGEDLGQARALLQAHIEKEKVITPEIKSTWSVTPNWDGGSTTPDPEPATASYVKVTEALTDYSGTYLFTYDDGAGSVKVFNGTDAEGNYTTVTATDGTIATGNADVDALVVTIEATEGGYFVKIGGQYIGGKSGSNGIVTSDKGILNTVAFANGTALFASNEVYLRYNTKTSNGDRFRYYKDNTSNNKFPAITLYKLTEG